MAAPTTQNQQTDTRAVITVLSCWTERSQKIIRRGDALIEVLHAAQGIFGFLENDLLVYMARVASIASQHGLWCCDILSFFPVEAEGRTYLRSLHGNRLLRERCFRNPNCHRGPLQVQAWRNDHRQQDLSYPSALCRFLRSCSCCRNR